MKIALASFAANLSRAKDLVRMHDHLASRTTSALDSTDVLRAALVLSVSALDHFIHELVRLGMLEVHQGRRPATRSFLAFPITLHATRTAIAVPATTSWLTDCIRDAHGWQTFQRPDKIAEAIRLISEVSLWDAVAIQLGADARAVKADLLAIVERRNKIAHEADMDPSFPGQRWPISSSLVEGALDFIDRLARAIYKLL